MTNFVKQYVLGNVVTLSQGLAINAKTKHLISNEGIPLLRITDLINGTFNQFIEKDLAPKKCLANYGEIIYTRTGQVGLVFNKFSGVVHNNCFKVTPNEEILEKDFLYWFLRQPKIRDYANSIANGSVQKDLDHASFKSIEISIPDKPHQNKAATILNLLEEKILLNQKMNQTLEDIAKAIFKSWFIDFDPVRAKVDGGHTGLPDEISDLFPSEFVDSELGEIPKGWQIKQIGDLCQVIDCLHTKKPELIQSGFNYIQLNEIGNDGLLHTQSISKISEIDYKKWVSRIEVCEGDCIITNVGRVGAFARIPYGFRGAIGRNITAMRPLLKDSTGSYIATYFLSPLFTKEKDSNTDSGTILDALNVKNIPKLRIVTPSDSLMEHANHLFNLNWKKRDLLNEENKTLSQLRDALLPRLISGELQIPDAKKFLDEVRI